jgi:hypothetical protein
MSQQKQACSIGAIPVARRLPGHEVAIVAMVATMKDGIDGRGAPSRRVTTRSVFKRGNGGCIARSGVRPMRELSQTRSKESPICKQILHSVVDFLTFAQQNHDFRVHGLPQSQFIPCPMRPECSIGFIGGQERVS